MDTRGLVLLRLASAAVLLSSGSAEDVVVNTTDGALRVAVEGGDVLVARGVQFAEHPVGALRWQPPVPVKAWGNSTTKDALSFGADCVNAPLLQRLFSIGFDRMAEECLYLNVWAPLNKSTNKGLPVQVWFYGGSFTYGGTSRYDGGRIMAVSKDVIVVSVNYRLGALGWLGGRAVSKTTRDGSAGNFGLQDTRAGLRWVQRNIAAFGGDPARVTIFGESAGSSLVAVHLVAPRSEGLFRRAIMESGAFDNYTVQADADASFRIFADKAGCRDPDDDAALRCLQRKPLRGPFGGLFGGGLLPAIGNTSYDGWFSPAVDRVELDAEPEVLAAAGKINPSARSVMIGTNLNEGRFLMPLTMPVPNAPRSSTKDLDEWLATNYGAFGRAALDEVRRRYADEIARSPWKAASAIYTESQYLCPTERSARWLKDAWDRRWRRQRQRQQQQHQHQHQHQQGKQQSRAESGGASGGGDVYLYQLTFEPAPESFDTKLLYWWYWCNTLGACRNDTVPVGVGHGADVPLVWNNKGLHAAGRALADKVIRYWQSFAATGAPTGDRPTPLTRGLPHWPPYLPGNLTLDLDAEPKVVANIGNERCAFWAKLHPVPFDRRRRRR